MTYRLGLTGSIGMGKTTTAAFFVALGLPVWSADEAVHRLYEAGGSAVGPLADLFPLAVSNGAISRAALKSIIAIDPLALKRIERVVHPLVATDRADFLARVTEDIAVLDIPLLFEGGMEKEMDATLLVTAPPQVQRARVMARPGMTESLFQSILARQMPDAEKRSRATHIIETLGLVAARECVAALIVHIREGTPRHA
jgi:dephospho-CoA kinase